MSIYFARVGDYFKIGYSADPVARVARLNRGSTLYTFPVDAPTSPKARELYRAVPGDKSAETRVHLALDNFSVGLEWFLDEPALREFIDTLPATGIPKRVAKLTREGGWCETEYRAVQHGRAQRAMARWDAKRGRVA